jgi:hypothetical protein
MGQNPQAEACATGINRLRSARISENSGFEKVRDEWEGQAKSFHPGY